MRREFYNIRAFIEFIASNPNLQEGFEISFRLITTEELKEICNFDVAQYITSLDLAWNRLETLPTEITKLERLYSLNIISNTLKSLPPKISELTNLNLLNLSGNKLIVLPPEVTNLTRLQSLHLTCNKLKFLPPEVTRLTRLQSLHLSDNELIVFPPEVIRLTSLQSLRLSENKLIVLPPEIVRLAMLQELYLSENKLIVLPPEITRLTNLKILSLRNNSLTYLPFGMENLQNLRALDLTRNELLTILPIGIFRAPELFLSPTLYPIVIKILNPKNTKDVKSKLKTLKTSYKQSTQLCCVFDDFELFKEFNETSTIILPKVKLKVSEKMTLDQLNQAIEKLEKHGVKALDISGNGLKEVPESLHVLHALESLDITDNKITAEEFERFFKRCVEQKKLQEAKKPCQIM
jgi:Leucine-rich repeat (LRR) protein